MSSERSELGAGPFGPTAAMVVAGPILVGASPPQPVPDEGSGGGSGPTEASEQVMGFAGG